MGRQKLGKILVLAVISVWVAVFPFVFPEPFPQHVMIQIFSFVLLGQAWNIVGGYAGQWSLGHAAFFGIGAYTSTLLLLNWNISPWLGTLVGIGMANVLAVAIGLPSLRLRTHWFAMATLSLAEIVRLLSLQPPISDYTGGAYGLVFPSRFFESPFFYLLFSDKPPYYYISLGLAILSILVVYRIERSKFGLYLKAIKEDEERVQSMGINTTLHKLAAFMMSASLAAMGGTFYAHYVLYIDPYAVFPILLSVTIMIVAIAGGLGTVWGPVAGAAVLMPLADYSRVFLGPAGIGMQFIAYGILIVIVVTYAPGGIYGLLRGKRGAGPLLPFLSRRRVTISLDQAGEKPKSEISSQ